MAKHNWYCLYWALLHLILSELVNMVVWCLFFTEFHLSLFCSATTYVFMPPYPNFPPSFGIVSWAVESALSFVVSQVPQAQISKTEIIFSSKLAPPSVFWFHWWHYLSRLPFKYRVSFLSSSLPHSYTKSVSLANFIHVPQTSPIHSSSPFFLS